MQNSIESENQKLKERLGQKLESEVTNSSTKDAVMT